MYDDGQQLKLLYHIASHYLVYKND
jgi:hypothetical protein